MKMIPRLNRSGKVFIFFSFIFAADFSLVQSTSEEQLANVSLRIYKGKTIDDHFYNALASNPIKLLDHMDLKKPTLVYIHGYNEHLERDSVKSIIGAYLSHQDYNAIAVDWSEIAGQNYVIVAESAPDVGKVVAKALNELVSNSLDPKTIHVVAHSMGAQVAGNVGRNVNFKLPRITGLDPAGPGFYILIDHLSSTDAEFVDVIHTDAGVYGIAEASGGADFYPNRGNRIQPGCPWLFIPLDSGDFCSHHRSWRFYAESVINEKAFVAIECKHYYKFSSKRCKNNKKIPMGFATPPGTKGSFYLETNSKSPYGRGEKGVIPT